MGIDIGQLIASLFVGVAISLIAAKIVRVLTNRPLRVVLSVAAAFFIVGVVVTAVSYPSIVLVEIPDLTGLSKDEAELRLVEKGLIPIFNEQYSDTVDKGRVISQDLSSGLHVRKGSDVRFVVSKGPTPTPTLPVGLVDSDAGKTESVQKNSLHVAYNDDFEDIKDPIYEDWVAGPTGKNHRWDPSDKYAHSGTHSLELSVNIQPYKKNPLIEYGSIGISDLNIHKAKIIEAWALVPKSDQARGSNIMSHIIVHYKNSSGKYITILSEDEKLKPGVWTQMFLGVCYKINSTNCICEWDGKIDELYLTFWSDQNYGGPIYFDDITIWK